MSDAAVAPATSPAEGGGAPPPEAGQAPPPSGGEQQPEAKSEGPAPIPYLAFKQERSRWQARARDIEHAKAAEIQRIQQEHQALQAQHRELTERFSNFDALQRVIRGNPELAQQIEEALGQETPRQQQQAIAALPPEAQQVIAQMGQFLQHHQQTEAQRAQAQEQAELNNVHQEVRGVLTDLLTKKGFEAKEMLPFVESYVLNRLRTMGESAEMSDVPLIAAEWVGTMQKWHQNQLSNLANGKREDGRLPASPGSSAPVTPGKKPYALDDGASKAAMAFLQNAGWRE